MSDPSTDYAARIKAGLVDCNVYAESADCPCCDAQDALASLEAELAEARKGCQFGCGPYPDDGSMVGGPGYGLVPACPVHGWVCVLLDAKDERAEQAEAALRDVRVAIDRYLDERDEMYLMDAKRLAVATGEAETEA